MSLHIPPICRADLKSGSKVRQTGNEESTGMRDHSLFSENDLITPELNVEFLKV